MEITSDFAILDVKEGRHELAEHILAGGQVSLVVHILLDHVHSRDDGTSIEFGGIVNNIGSISPIPAKEIA